MAENKMTTKERLDELRELLSGGYITESEFKTARVGILSEGGIDISGEFGQDDEEEAPRESGCGYFIGILVLIAVIAAGAFFAAPHWPEAYGGAGLLAARNWAVGLYEEIASFFPANSQVTAIPTDSDSGAEQATAASPQNGADEAEPASSDAVPEAVPDESADQTPEMPSPANMSALPPLLSVLDMPAAASPDGSAPDKDHVTIIVVPSALEGTAGARTAGAEAARTEAAQVRGGFVSARSNARIRSEPDTSTNDNVTGWGRSGDRLQIFDEQTGKDGAKWYNVRYGDGTKQGWISGSLVTLD